MSASLSPSTTLVASPTQASLRSYQAGGPGIYAAAKLELAQKVSPKSFSQDELDSFLKDCTKDNCNAEFHVRDLLRDMEVQNQHHSRFHGFFEGLNKLFVPLRFFKGALDTLCQSHSTFCLVWGSMKALMEIAEKATQIPAIINDGIQTLLRFFPLFEQHQHAFERLNADESLLLEKPLVAIYVEYLTFCILARKVANSKKRATLRYMMHDDENPFALCLTNVETQVDLVHQAITILTLNGVTGVAGEISVIRKILSNMTSRSRSSSSTAQSARFHKVPGILSSVFVGRDADLNWLKETLRPEDEPLVGVRVGIHGMTGMGKTQLMLKYESQFRRYYSAHFFLVATTEEKLMGSIQDMLEMMDLPQRNETNPTLKWQGLHNWLCQFPQWLLLIDNIGSETVGLVKELLAADAPGHVILTSQHKSATESITGSSKSCHHLRDLSLRDSVEMFIDRADMQSTSYNQSLATQVVQAVGLVPQAIQQAASYIKVNGIQPNDFLTRYSEAPEQILEWDGDNYHANPKSTKDYRDRAAIGKRFHIIFETLEKFEPDAWVVLRFYSLLEPESIPLFDSWHRAEQNPGFFEETTTSVPPRRNSKGLLHLFCCLKLRERGSVADTTSGEAEKVPSHCSETLVNIFKDRERRENAIALLCDLSLILRVEGKQALWMHDLTKTTARCRIPPKDLISWIKASNSVFFHMLPERDNTIEEREWVDTCLPQAIGMIEAARGVGVEATHYAGLLLLCAKYNLDHGSWAWSQKQLTTVMPIYEAHLGEEHLQTIDILERLAWATRHVGDMKVSETYFKRAWKSREKMLGPDAPETLQCLDALASTIERAGRLKEAEEMFVQLLELNQQAFGNKGASTIGAAHNLAVCLFNQGRLAEAEDLYRFALEASEETLGSHHQGTLKTMSNYAATLDHDGRHDEAQALYDRALTLFVRLMGVNHQLTLRLRCNRAGLLRHQGYFKDAEMVMSDCLEAVLRVFGAESFEAMHTQYDMAKVWHDKGDVQRARNTIQDIMKSLNVEMLEHPVVFRFLSSWGALERELGHLDAAEEKSKEAYERFSALIGCYDPYTLMAANDYAEALQAQGRYSESRSLLIKCRDSFESMVGNEHPHYAMILNNLGRLSWVSKEDPMRFFEKARAAFDARLGSGHFCTLIVSLNIARTHFAAGNFDYALANVQEIRAGLELLIGASHPLVSACDIVLGSMFASHQGELSLLKARDHLRTAVETAQRAQLVASTNYYLSVCLLIIVLRRLQADTAAIKPLLQLISPTAVEHLSPFDIPNVGKFTIAQILDMEPNTFDFSTYIPLAVGESTKLRWGRKSCWRGSEDAQLRG